MKTQLTRSQMIHVYHNVFSSENAALVLEDMARKYMNRSSFDPNNPYLNGHLRSTLDRKLDLLRRAAKLPRVS